MIKVLQCHCRSFSNKQLTHILFSEAIGLQHLDTEAVNTDRGYARPHPFSCCHLTAGISFCHLCRAERDSVALKLYLPLETLSHCPVLLQHSIFWFILSTSSSPIISFEAVKTLVFVVPAVVYRKGYINISYYLCVFCYTSSLSCLLLATFSSRYTTKIMQEEKAELRMFMCR